MQLAKATGLTSAPTAFETSHEDAAQLLPGSASVHYRSRASSVVFKSSLVLALIPAPFYLIISVLLRLSCSADLQLYRHSYTPHLGKPGIRLVNFSAM